MLEVNLWQIVAFLIFSVSIVTSVSVNILNENKISRSTREVDTLRQELQKLRKILEKVQSEKINPPTTDSSASVDYQFNAIVRQLKNGDEAALLKLARALRKLKNEKSLEEKSKEDEDSVGDYLGQAYQYSANSNENKQESSSQEIMDILRKVYNEERTKQQKEKMAQHRTTQRTTTAETLDQSGKDLKKDVLHAIEKQLLRDIGIAVNYGFSPREIINDLSKQHSKK